LYAWPFVLWLENTTLTSQQFIGAIGHQYAFISLAMDQVGNRQPVPLLAQATTIVVDPNSPQDILLSIQSVSESAPADSVVGIWSTVDYKVDDHPTFELLDDAGGRFAIVGNELRIVAGSNRLDFETATSLTIQVKATNSAGASLIKSFTIDVLNANESPTGIVLSGNDVVENSIAAIIGSVTVSDPDVGDTFDLLVDDARFEIVDGVLRLQADVSLDFELASSLQLVITAIDSGGLRFTAPFTITVVNVNEPPTAIVLLTDTVLENAVGAAIGTMTATDPDANDTLTIRVSDVRFDIVAGVLRLKEGLSLDFEQEPSVRVTITATDQGGLSFDQEFTISVIDVNEPPTGVTLSASTVLENLVGAAIGSVVGADPDADDTITFGVSDVRFEIVDGMFRLKEGQSLDFEQEPSVRVTITATDHGELSFDQEFTISVLDINEPPTAIVLSSNTVLETVVGAVIGSFSATDPDAANTLTIRVNDDRFDIVAGVLRLKEGLSLDFEQEPSVRVTITATDQGGLSLDQEFALVVVDANDPPVATAPIPDQFATVSVPFTYSLAADLFQDQDLPFSLTLRANLIDGSDLPPWLTFDAALGTLQGTPASSDVTELDMRITATDAGTPPFEAHVDFKLTVNPAVNEFPWHNLENPFDVNHNGSIEPLDALVIINYLNEKGAGRLPDVVTPPEFLLDTNKDGSVTPLDVLLVINKLNQPAADREGGSVEFDMSTMNPMSIGRASRSAAAEVANGTRSSARPTEALQPDGFRRPGNSLRNESESGAEWRFAHLRDVAWADGETLLIALDDLLLSELASPRS
ncbi:MAG: putative Ig domain-containing protein, partial [Betaproteobacteria bacterium]